MQPPVSHSNCFPACSSRCPYGTATGNFSPVRSQANRPGYLDFPWIVRKLKSQWQPAKMVPTSYFCRSLPVGANLCSPPLSALVKMLLQSPRPTAAISATVQQPLIMCLPQLSITSLNSGKSSGAWLGYRLGTLSSVLTSQKYLHLASKGGGIGVIGLFSGEKLLRVVPWSLAFSVNQGVAPT